VRKSLKELFKYELVGIVGLGVDLGVFFLFRDVFGIPYWIAAIIGNIAGIFNNFLMNSFFTFKTTDKIVKRGISFGGIAAVGLVINAFMTPLTAEIFLPWIIKVSSEPLGFSPDIASAKTIQTIAKMLVTFFVAMLQFVANKYITFKKTDSCK